MSGRGHASPFATLTSSGLHFNMAAVVVASCASAVSLLTCDQQMLIREVNIWREGLTFFGAGTEPGISFIRTDRYIRGSQRKWQPVNVFRQWVKVDIAY